MYTINQELSHNPPDNLQLDFEFPQPLAGVRSRITSSTIKTVDTGFQAMDFRYRWKNGAPPSRDVAAREKHLLDESQFHTDQDRQLAEEAARKHLNIPLRTPDDDTPVLPQ